MLTFYIIKILTMFISLVYYNKPFFNQYLNKGAHLKFCFNIDLL